MIFFAFLNRNITATTVTIKKAIAASQKAALKKAASIIQKERKSAVKAGIKNDIIDASVCALLSAVNKVLDKNNIK